MFPAYGYNYAYPHGKPQMPADHPNSEAFPPEMKLQKPNSPFMYEPWPQNFGYPVPMPYHSCCNHSPYPGYYACRPPYPRFPSPQPHPRYHEAYSLYPEPYPFHYAPPPQYFPGWNYNMSVPRDFHCSECPHNKSHMGEKSVKIEEHEPEAEKHDSGVPAGFSNPQHPIVWIPPDYLKKEGSPAGNKSPKDVQSASRDPNMRSGWFPLDLESIKRLLEDGGVKRSQDQRNGSGVRLQEKKAEDDRPQQELKSDGGVPNIWNGWMPLDLDKIKRLLQNEELKNDQGNQTGSQKQQMPSPIIWLPYDKEEKSQVGKKEDADAASEASVQRPSNSHFIPVQQGDAQKQKTIPTIEAESDTNGPSLPEKKGNVVKIIPVKQAEECIATKTKNDAQGKCDDSAKGIRNNKMDDGAKNKPVSPKKASKLPPVCLRVDPLPKKKNAKGNSRSPSPPGQRSERAESVKSQSSTSENNINQAIEGAKDEAKKKSEKLMPQKKDMDTRKDEVVENRQEPKSQKVGIKPGEAHKPAHKVLSSVEAAIIIQSAFRGYEVRRWEPLKKLRRIAAVRENAAEVRKSIESAPGPMGIRQKVALGETLMKLLLDLDTIQGLHPSVRDFRKSLASELVRLQERLHSLVIEQPNNSPGDPKAIETITTSDNPSMSPALTAADGQQGGEASKQVCPEKEIQRGPDGQGNAVLPEESSSKPSMQQIEPDVKDEAANENPIQMCQADELSPVAEAVETGTEEKLEKPVECESIPEPEAGLLDQTHEENDSHTTDEVPQMTSQQEAKLVLGAEELNNEELEAPEEVSKDEELETPIAEHEEHEDSLSKPSMQQIEPDVKEEAAIENPIQECQGNESCPEVSPLTEAVETATEEKLERPVECEFIPETDTGLLVQAHEKSDSHSTTDVAPRTMSQQEAIKELSNEELEAPEEVSKGEEHEAPEEVSKGKKLEAREGISKGRELETPTAEHEKREPRGLSEGGELKEQAAVFPASESAIRESCVNAIEPVIAGESSCVELGEEGLFETLPETAPVVEPESNIKAEFEEPEENHPTADSQAEEPAGNPAENGTGKDEKMNEEDGRDQLSSVMNNKKLDDEATEGQELEAPPISEHEKHESAEPEGGEEPQLEADSQSECRNEAVQDEKTDEAGSKDQIRMMEENEKMRDLVEKLIASGKQQQEVISNLNGKLKDLETKLAKQRRKKRRGRVQMPRSCKESKGSSNEAAMGLAS